MRKFTIAMLAVAAGLTAQGIGAPSAEAMTPARAAATGHVSHPSHLVQVRHRGHHFRFNGGMRHHNGIHHGFRRHYWGGPRIHFYGGGGGCYWLKEKAKWTGSRYWWRRYWACRNGW